MLPLHQSPILESADRLALSHKSFADFHITIFAMLTLVRRERLALPEPSDTWFTARTATIYGISTHMAEAVGLAPTTRSSRATRFQDELFIQPDCFHGAGRRTRTSDRQITCMIKSHVPYHQAIPAFIYLAEEERLELSRRITMTYRFSKPAPSPTWVLFHKNKWRDCSRH